MRIENITFGYWDMHEEDEKIGYSSEIKNDDKVWKECKGCKNRIMGSGEKKYCEECKKRKLNKNI